MAPLFEPDWARPAWMPADWLPSSYSDGRAKRPAPDDSDAVTPEPKRTKIAADNKSPEKQPAPEDSSATSPEMKRTKTAAYNNSPEKRPAPEDSGAIPPEPKRTKISLCADENMRTTKPSPTISPDPFPTTVHPEPASGPNTPPPISIPSDQTAFRPDQTATATHAEAVPNPRSLSQSVSEHYVQLYNSDDDKQWDPVLNCTQPSKPTTLEVQSHVTAEIAPNDIKCATKVQVSQPKKVQEDEKVPQADTRNEKHTARTKAHAEEKQEVKTKKRRDTTGQNQKKLDRLHELQAEKSSGGGWNTQDKAIEAKQNELTKLLKWKSAKEKREAKKLASVQIAEKPAKDTEEFKNMTEEQKDIEEKLRAIASGEDNRTGEAFGELKATNDEAPPAQTDTDPVTKTQNKDIDLSIYDPIEHHVFVEGEEHFGKYHSRTTFECDPCPEEFKYSKVDLHNKDNLEHTKANERRMKTDGKVSTKRHRWTGVHVINGIFERRSAAHKYMEWRRITLRKVDKVNAKKPRLVTLIEREPCGMAGEAGKWAGKVRSLKEMLKILAPESHITIVLDVKPSAWVSGGYSTEWYQAILDMLRDWPKNIDVRIEDDSILNTESDGEPHADFCRKFVKDVNHLHEHGSLP